MSDTLNEMVDQMINAPDREDMFNDADETPDAPSVSEAPAEGTPPKEDTAAPADADKAASTASNADANGEAGGGRAKPQIYDQHLPSDKHGNLVDHSGRIVARAGNERAYYETARNAMRRLREAGSELDRADTELAAYRAAATAPEKFQLTPSEAVAGMQWAALYKTNPAQAVKDLLTDAASRGIEVPGLGIDMAAIQKMIKDSVAPFQKDREAEQQQAEALEAGKREWEELTAEFGWLPRHEAAFAQLLNQHPNMTPMQIALRIERQAMQRGIDLYNPVQEAPRQNRAAAPAQTTTGDMTPQATTRPAPVTQNNVRQRIRDIMRANNFSLER